MIAVDTSVLVAIAKDEPEHKRFSSLLARGDAMVGAATLVETRFVLSSILDDQDTDIMIDRLIHEGGLRPVDFTPAMADAAVNAFRRFGKGRGHLAKLNFGDCMAYAVAKVHRVPLLYKGDDFAQTDIAPALT